MLVCLVVEIIKHWILAFADPLWPCVKVIETSMSKYAMDKSTIMPSLNAVLINTWCISMSEAVVPSLMMTNSFTRNRLRGTHCKHTQIHTHTQIQVVYGNICTVVSDFANKNKDFQTNNRIHEAPTNPNDIGPYSHRQDNLTYPPALLLYYSPVNRTGSPRGISLVQMGWKPYTIPKTNTNKQNLTPKTIHINKKTKKNFRYCPCGQ